LLVRNSRLFALLCYAAWSESNPKMHVPVNYVGYWLHTDVNKLLQVMLLDASLRITKIKE
jgi:hypothetical protein